MLQAVSSAYIIMRWLMLDASFEIAWSDGMMASAESLVLAQPPLCITIRYSPQPCCASAASGANHRCDRQASSYLLLFRPTPLSLLDSMHMVVCTNCIFHCTIHPACWNTLLHCCARPPGQADFRMEWSNFIKRPSFTTKQPELMKCSGSKEYTALAGETGVPAGYQHQKPNLGGRRGCAPSRHSTPIQPSMHHNEAGNTVLLS